MSTRFMGCLVVLGLFLVAGLGIAFFLFGQFNDLIRAGEAVAAQWSQVENVYQRRADLVPNLIETVKGSSEFEQETLNQVVEARSRVGQLQVDADEVLGDPQAFARFTQTQDALSSALQRLLVVVEQYPELHTVQAYRDLMVQLEGTENRIAVERRRFNEVARDYNVRLKRIPSRWFNALLGWGFEERPYFEASHGAEESPKVEF